MSKMSPMTDANLSMRQWRQESRSMMGELICTTESGACIVSHSS